MGIPATNNKASNKPSTPSEPKTAPNNTPKKPQDNTAAKSAPKETKTAVQNTFGDTPKSGNAKQPVDTPKGNGDGDAKQGAPTKQTGNPAPPAANGKVPADPKSADPQSADPKAPPAPDPKAAPGKPSATAKDTQGNPYMVLPDGKYATTDKGSYVVYDKAVGDNPVAVDPKTEMPETHLNGSPLAINDYGNYIKSPNGQYNVVYDKNNDFKLAIVDPATGAISKDANGNPYMVQKDGQVAKTGAGNPIVYDGKSGKNPAAIDPQTGETAKDANGYTLAIGKDGNFIPTSDGQANVVYDKDNGNKLAIIDPASGKVAQDGSGNPYMVLPDGQYAVTGTGNPVVYDKANANKPVAIDPQTGNAIKDPGGNILAIGKDGNFITTPNGDTVAYKKDGNKTNLVATGADGNPLVINGHPAAVDENGNYRQTANQQPIVYDQKGNPVALDENGKIVVDQNGNAQAFGKDGNFLPGVVFDKSTGFMVKTVDGEIQKNDNGMAFALNEDGQFIMGKDGKAAVYDPRGVPVQHAGKTPETGSDVYEDVTTGEKVAVVNGYVYKIDSATGDVAKDADGNILPAIYDPVNSDPNRPPVKPNENVATTLKNLPQGKERGDPMKIKDELFDEKGNLDVNKIQEAAAKYDPRDIYDALINSSKYGGWDKVPQDLEYGGTIVHPNEAQSREAIAALIAWQNENGKYNPLTQGKVPAIIFYSGGSDQAQGYTTRDEHNIYIGLDHSVGIPGTLFHEMNHALTSEPLRKAYQQDGLSPHLEVMTEFLGNNWTGNWTDVLDEFLLNPQAYRSLEVAVKKMGNGDPDKGLDILKRAYFGGDLAALDVLKKHFPPGEDFPAPDNGNYEGGEPNFQA